MLRELAGTTTARTLLGHFAERYGGECALLDLDGKTLKSFGTLPFVCQIVHNKDERLCSQNCKLHDTQPRYACEAGLATFSAPLILDEERIGTLVARGYRLTEDSHGLEVLQEQIGVALSELQEEFSQVKLTSPDTCVRLDDQLRALAAVIVDLCHEELRKDRKIQSLSSFQKLHTLLSTTTEFEGVIENTLTFLTTQFPFTHAVVHLSDLGQAYLSTPISFPREEIESRLSRNCGSYSQMIPDIAKDFSLSSIEGAQEVHKSVLAIPILGADQRIALFFCYGEAGLELNEVEQELLDVLKMRFRDVVIKHLQLESAQRTAITDRLTTLFNRRYFNDRLSLELAECRETKHPISLILCDLDHFKALNDTYGHQKGDEVLTLFGRILKDTVRKSDIACRYGGEEFVIILPKTPLSDAKMVAGRIREAVEQHDFGYIEEQRPVTVSVGLATCSTGNIEANHLLKEADSALYRAKNLGRNRVECSLVVDKNMGSIDVNEVDDLYVQKGND